MGLAQARSGAPVGSGRPAAVTRPGQAAARGSALSPPSARREVGKWVSPGGPQEQPLLSLRFPLSWGAQGLGSRRAVSLERRCPGPGRRVPAPRRSARRLPLPACGRRSCGAVGPPATPSAGPFPYYGNSDIQRERLARTAAPRLPRRGRLAGRTAPCAPCAPKLRRPLSPPPPAPGRCGAPLTRARPRWPASCGQDLAARAPPPGKDASSASGGTLPHCSYMAKFLAELLGCTLPSKGASPMFEVGGGCVPAATAVCGGARPLTGVLGSPGVDKCGV